MKRKRLPEQEDDNSVPAPKRRKTDLQERTTRRNNIISGIHGLIRQEVPGDGHCLYHSVGLWIGMDYVQLRQLVVNAINGNLSHYGPIIRALNPNITVEQYLNGVGSREWADDLEISVLMLILNRPIAVVNLNGSIRNLTAITDDGATGDPIYVLFNDNHYDGLIRAPVSQLDHISSDSVSTHSNSSSSESRSRSRRKLTAHEQLEYDLKYNPERVFQSQLQTISSSSGSKKAPRIRIIPPRIKAPRIRIIAPRSSESSSSGSRSESGSNRKDHPQGKPRGPYRHKNWQTQRRTDLSGLSDLLTTFYGSMARPQPRLRARTVTPRDVSDKLGINNNISPQKASHTKQRMRVRKQRQQSSIKRYDENTGELRTDGKGIPKSTWCKRGGLLDPKTWEPSTKNDAEPYKTLWTKVLVDPDTGKRYSGSGPIPENFIPRGTYRYRKKHPQSIPRGPIARTVTSRNNSTTRAASSSSRERMTPATADGRGTTFSGAQGDLHQNPEEDTGNPVDESPVATPPTPSQRRSSQSQPNNSQALLSQEMREFMDFLLLDFGETSTIPVANTTVPRREESTQVSFFSPTSGSKNSACTRRGASEEMHQFMNSLFQMKP